MKILMLIFGLFISNYGFCYYLSTDMRGQFTQQVIGNGTEEGISVLVSYQHYGQEPLASPLISIPNNFNCAECQVKSIEMLGLGLDANYLFRVIITSKPIQNSGGCHIVFGHPFFRMLLGNLTYQYNKD